MFLDSCFVKERTKPVNGRIDMLRTRTNFAIAAMIIIVGAAVAILMASQKKPLEVSSKSDERKAYRAAKVKNADISYDFEVSGTISAWNKIDIYAEVSGILLNTGQSFREGQSADNGDVLAKIDDEVYRNSLLAEKSGFLTDLTGLLADISIDFPEREEIWKSYLDSFRLDQPVAPLPEPASTRERNYIAARNIYSHFHSIQSMTAQLRKYTITAPFFGVITEANINPGTLVMNGQKLGAFASTADFELEASVGLGDIDHVAVGDTVALTSGDIAGDFWGVVERVNQRIEPRSQTVSVYIRVRDDRLKDGMYLTATLESTEQTGVMQLPKVLLVGGDALYIIEDSALALRSVDIVAETGDDVLVRNLQDGTLVLVEDIEGAAEGTRIDAYTVGEGE